MTPTSTVKPKKKEAVQNIVKNIQESSLLAIADFRGLSVQDINAIRAKLREQNAKMQVYKNTLTRIAFKECNIEYPKEMLIGPSVLINTTEDIINISKALVESTKAYEHFEIKGGVLEQKIINNDVIEELAKLPGREALIAKAVMLIKSPITNFVMTLSNPIRNLTYVLNSIKEKKQEVKND
jgi:large subunit ribosomal protein L10